ncbi:hypothetical protein L2E82_22025 [Cichorium intybus]|uniref:Uncharacterized protein n=1 Tax=Cichorium intybus TaxID=13427 RepID=A0ACB9DWE6_CICIN|nr:hypothetical protein L2E82_22025 [Cichorium intybus]
MLPNRSPTEFQNHMNQVPAQLEIDYSFLDFEGLEDILNDEIFDLCFLLNTEEDIPSPSDPSQKEWSTLNRSSREIDASVDMITLQPSMVLPSERMETYSQVIDLHLLMAYCEGMEKELKVLADAIGKRLIEKANPIGEISERLLYYLFQTHHKQLDYLKKECMKNFRVCSRAFYHLFPYGMFAHMAANSAILNAIRQDADTLHIFDFDIGNGVQWSSLVTASELQQKELRITSIRWNNAESWTEDPSNYFSFEETKKQLYDHARAFDLKLTMDEIELCNIKKIKKKCNEQRGVRAFNCMVSLPHMMKGRSRKDVLEFMKVAEQFACDSQKVVITFGDGDACESYDNQEGLCSFFEENMSHYEAILESMDHSFSKHHKAAKTAMECLFVAPFVSLNAWMQKWEVQKQLRWEPVFEGWKVSEEIIFESKLMVREGDGTMHQVKVEGDSKNQIILLWKKHPLVRVSFWKS